MTATALPTRCTAMPPEVADQLRNLYGADPWARDWRHAARKRAFALEQHRALVADGEVATLPDAAWWLRMAVRYSIALRWARR